MKARVSDLDPNLIAVSAHLLGCSATVASSGFGQYGLPPEEIVAFMGLFMAITLMLQAQRAAVSAILRPRAMVRQVLRASLTDMTNNRLRRHRPPPLSLTMFYILVFTSPMFISLLGSRRSGFVGSSAVTSDKKRLLAAATSAYCGRDRPRSLP